MGLSTPYKVEPVTIVLDSDVLTLGEGFGLPDALAYLEKVIVEQAIDQTDNKSEAAAILGVSRPTLWRKIRRYGL